MITVAMVAGGNPELTLNAVRTLKETARDKFQLILVDNSADYGEDVAGHVWEHCDFIIRNEVGNSFSKSNNQALEHAQGEHFLGLNNDTLATGDWQTPLLSVAERYDLCGPNVRRLVRYDEHKLLLCHRPDGKMAEADPSEKMAYVEGWCFFIKTALLRSLNGLDEAFWPMYCEDADLSFRVRAGGGLLGKVKVPITHIGMADTRKYLPAKFRDTVGMANCYKLYARWIRGATI